MVGKSLVHELRGYFTLEALRSFRPYTRRQLFESIHTYAHDYFDLDSGEDGTASEGKSVTQESAHSGIRGFHIRSFLLLELSCSDTLLSGRTEWNASRLSLISSVRILVMKHA